MLTTVKSADINSITALNTALASNTDVGGIRHYVDMAVDTTRHYTPAVPIYKVSTTAAVDTDIIFDPSGNMYWAVVANGVSSGYTSISTVYRITTDGSMTICARVTNSTTRAGATALVYDPLSNSIFWSIGMNETGITSEVNSYLYKLNPASTGIIPTPYKTKLTKACSSTALAVDGITGTIYWAVANTHSSIGLYNQNSYVYKITSAGVITDFCIKPTTAAAATSLVCSDGVLYWSIANNKDAGGIAAIHRITSSGIPSTIVSITAPYARDAQLIMHPSGDLYWAIANVGSADPLSTIPSQRTSYIYKIVPDTTNPVTPTVFARHASMQALGTSITIDANGDFFWALPQNLTTPGLGYSSVACHVYHIDGITHKLTPLASFPAAGAGRMCIKTSPLGYLFWSIMRVSQYPITTNLAQYVVQISKLRRF